MSAQVSKALNARVLMTLGGVVLTLFIISGLIASKYGQHAEGTAGAIGSIAWFGFLLGALVLVVLSVASLVARGVSRGGSAQGRSTT